jgi:hypothetical protein
MQGTWNMSFGELKVGEECTHVAVVGKASQLRCGGGTAAIGGGKGGYYNAVSAQDMNRSLIRLYKQHCTQ